LGGFVDRAIFGSKTRISQEGSRITDLMVQASTYGKAIPLVYGNARIAGNIIWSRPIQENITTTTQSSGGGKGGGGGSVETTTTTYNYTASLAVAICEGPITEVVRVWADSKQLDLTQGSYTLYLGDEAQLPDIIAEAAPAIPVLSAISEMVKDNALGFLIALGVLVVASAAYIAWARIDDRKKGLV
jgi:hypothetical protein